MKDITIYFNEQIINEGLVSGSISLQMIKNVDPQDLLTGLLNMYDYICDEDDINLFYQDFPVKEQLFWKNMYTLYEKQVWSMFDYSDDSDIQNSTSNPDKELDIEPNTLTKVTVEFRRNLRNIIKNSRNNKLDIKPSAPDKVLLIQDSQFNKQYIITINRTTGLFGKLFRAIDIKFLEKALERMGNYMSDGKIRVED